MNGRTIPMPITISVLITKIEENRFTAHALEVDLVCEAGSPNAALDKLVTAFRSYVEYAVTSDQLGNLFFAAPKEFWDEFYAIEQEKQFTRRPVAPVAQNPVTMFWAMMNANRLAAQASPSC